MDRSTLESLPNELLLAIFSYLSSFDLCQAFLDLENTRIEHLLTSMRHTLDVSEMNFGQLCRFLNDINQGSTKRFISLVDTIIVQDLISTWRLFNRLKAVTNDVSQSYPLFSSAKKLLVFDADRFWFDRVHILSSPLVFHNGTFQHLHVVFETVSSMYASLLSELITHRISVHTMIFEVEKGIGRVDLLSMEALDELNSLHWPNTVQLTLTVMNSSELLLLLRRDALPRIEHLEVTIEVIRCTLPLTDEQSVTHGIQMDAYPLRETMDGTRLRFLLLRFITLGDFIELMGLLDLPSLQELILIDLSDHTLDHLSKFQELCQPAHLPSLKRLHFSFCFPGELEYAWRSSSFVSDKRWPFDDVDFFIDKNRICIYDDLKTTFVLYKRPINVILQHKRMFHNDYWTIHGSVSNRTTRRRSIQWTCDETYQSNRFLQALQTIAGDHVDKLDFEWPEKRVYRKMRIAKEIVPSNNIQNQTIALTASKCFDNQNFLLRHLRSLKFCFSSESTERSQRVSIIEQILSISPKLSRLHVNWDDFRCCSQTYSNLKYLQLVLTRFRTEPKQHVNVRRLTQLAPRLCSLVTSSALITYDENLLKFLLKIIRNFNQLIHLAINKDVPYHAKQNRKIMFREKLLATGHGRVFDSTNIRVKCGFYEDLDIWL